ncbi:MAG TPA: PfkB family carbohydrate kinase, partial [Planctomycetaceae bacterium]|nr:PfkB family carbohydrate kinase [Planctomycetaceae bacterium]
MGMRTSINELTDGLAHSGPKRLLVMGDLMLDRYTLGEAGRVSPEAPALVLSRDEELVRPGGGANVAAFLRGLDVETTLIGTVGSDGDGRVLRRLLQELHIDCTGLVMLEGRPTTSKHRFVGRAAGKEFQHLLRVDCEDRTPIPVAAERRLHELLALHIPACDAVLLSDYAKGTLTETLISAAIGAAVEAGVPVLVDPSRDRMPALYTGATLVSPNRTTFQRWTGQSGPTEEAILAGLMTLRRQIDVETAVVTLDKDGMAYASGVGQGVLAGRRRTVCDVTGAGDMVLAMLGVGYAAGWALQDCLELANTAAGLEVERFGVEPISWDEIAAEASQATTAAKVISADRLLRQLAAHRQAGKSIAFTNGCFDLLHVGHITMLEEAARTADILIVAMNSDSSVRSLKGAARPIVNECDRAHQIAALGCVDYVIIFDEDTPIRL